MTTQNCNIPDEETALLVLSQKHARYRGRPITPLPQTQIAIVLSLKAVEALAAQCICPFINQLVSEMDITGGDKRKVGYYVGLVDSLVFVMEAATVLHWSRLSDRVGRKPIFLVGLSGLCISMLCFGLARTFSALLISRCLAGVLNGNIAVLKSAMGDLTDASNMAQAFGLFPMLWTVGATIGLSLGGTLSRPHERYPTIFGSIFWGKYPYFLPCASASFFVAISILVTVLFFNETLEATTKSKSRSRSNTDDTLVCAKAAERHSPVLSKNSAPDLNEDPVPLRELFVFRILNPIANYWALSFLWITFHALLPLFYSTPIEYGGLGLPPPVIGLCLGVFRFANGPFQAFFFNKFVRIWGPKWIFMVAMIGFLPLFMMFPIIHAFARQRGLSPSVWVLVASQLMVAMIMPMAFGSISMIITSASEKRSLGATNGLSQTTISIARAIGPTISTSLFAFSSEHNLLGGYAVFAIFFVLSCASVLLAKQLPDDTLTEEWEGTK